MSNHEFDINHRDKTKSPTQESDKKPAQNHRLHVSFLTKTFFVTYPCNPLIYAVNSTSNPLNIALTLKGLRLFVIIDSADVYPLNIALTLKGLRHITFFYEEGYLL